MLTKSTENNYPPYFCQNEKWTAFWKLANGQNHQIISWQNLQIYEYPWEVFGRRIGTFWYIPKAKMDQKTWLEFIDFINSINNSKKNKPEKKFEKTQNPKLNELKLESENEKNNSKNSEKLVQKSLQNRKRNHQIDFVKIDFDPSSIKEITTENVEKFENRPDLLDFDLDLVAGVGTDAISTGWVGRRKLRKVREASRIQVHVH